MFNLIYNGINNPQSIEPIINFRLEILGPESYKITIGKDVINFTRVLVIGIIGIGYFTLILICLAFMKTGMQILLGIYNEDTIIKNFLENKFENIIDEIIKNKIISKSNFTDKNIK